MTVASREFQILTKPMGAVCNLDCRYCYYLSKTDLYPGVESYRMPDDLLESYIVQHIDACPKETILFSWHGGEPTSLGLDFFRRVVELERKHQPEGRRILNGLQTNGTLIDEEWCRFFAANGFYVGLSIDGPAEFHDGYRVSKGGKPTHKQVLAAYRLLQSHRVSCDVLCVVHSSNVRHPLTIYRYFKDLGVKFLQFLPLVAGRPGGVASPETPPAEAYGQFLITVFREWIRQDVSRIGIQNFDEALKPFLGVDQALCIFRETCGDVPVVEHNGDFYACDHFVDRQHCIGNIRETPLVELLDSPAQRKFGDYKRDGLPRFCRECDVLALCHGGCPKDRFIRTPGGEDGLNYLCAGLHAFFSYSRPYLRELAAFVMSGRPLGEFALARAEGVTTAQAGRNEPCPCGSGKKYKKCCLANTR